MKKLIFHRTPHEIAEGIVLAQEGLRRMVIVVYHRGHRARVRPFEQGFQPTPWRCPRCGLRAVGVDALRYQFATIRIPARRALVDIRTFEHDRGWNKAVDRVLAMLQGPPNLENVRQGIAALRRVPSAVRVGGKS